MNSTNSFLEAVIPVHKSGSKQPWFYIPEKASFSFQAKPFVLGLILFMQWGRFRLSLDFLICLKFQGRETLLHMCPLWKGPHVLLECQNHGSSQPVCQPSTSNSSLRRQGNQGLVLPKATAQWAGDYFKMKVHGFHLQQIIFSPKFQQIIFKHTWPGFLQ